MTLLFYISLSFNFVYSRIWASTISLPWKGFISWIQLAHEDQSVKVAKILQATELEIFPPDRMADAVAWRLTCLGHNVIAWFRESHATQRKRGSGRLPNYRKLEGLCHFSIQLNNSSDCYSIPRLQSTSIREYSEYVQSGRVFNTQYCTKRPRSRHFGLSGERTGERTIPLLLRIVTAHAIH